MMGGIPRTILATVVLAYGAFTLWRRVQDGWRLKAVVESVTQDDQDPSAPGQ
jgi:hypothetical protein